MGAGIFIEPSVDTPAGVDKSVFIRTGLRNIGVRLRFVRDAQGGDWIYRIYSGTRCRAQYMWTHEATQGVMLNGGGFNYWYLTTTQTHTWASNADAVGATKCYLRYTAVIGGGDLVVEQDLNNTGSWVSAGTVSTNGVGTDYTARSAVLTLPAACVAATRIRVRCSSVAAARVQYLTVYNPTSFPDDNEAVVHISETTLAKNEDTSFESAWRLAPAAGGAEQYGGGYYHNSTGAVDCYQIATSNSWLVDGDPWVIVGGYTPNLTGRVQVCDMYWRDTPDVKIGVTTEVYGTNVNGAMSYATNYAPVVATNSTIRYMGMFTLDFPGNVLLDLAGKETVLLDSLPDGDIDGTTDIDHVILKGADASELNGLWVEIRPTSNQFQTYAADWLFYWNGVSKLYIKKSELITIAVGTNLTLSFDWVFRSPSVIGNSAGRTGHTIGIAIGL